MDKIYGIYGLPLNYEIKRDVFLYNGKLKEMCFCIMVN